MYEITVIEEEWRADPDGWLAKKDRRGEPTTDSKYSSSKCGDEDLELMSFEIRGDDEADIDEDPLQEEGNLNLINEEVTVGAQLVRKEENGPVTDSGLLVGSIYGLKEGFGPNLSETKVQETEGLSPKTDSGKTSAQKSTLGGDINNNLQLGIRDLREKKRKNLKDCYPQVSATISAAGSQGSTD
ncbi:hypothetical protein SLA2020_067150 [Shorea laevis]